MVVPGVLDNEDEFEREAPRWVLLMEVYLDLLDLVSFVRRVLRDRRRR